jgi:hypothetical protein
MFFNDAMAPDVPIASRPNSRSSFFSLAILPFPSRAQSPLAHPSLEESLVKDAIHAIRIGVAWLEAHQQDDGCWSNPAFPAMTGLAVFGDSQQSRRGCLGRNAGIRIAGIELDYEQRSARWLHLYPYSGTQRGRDARL